MKLFSEPWGNYLLSELVETEASSDISWWPETVGWKILLIGLLTFLAYKAYQSWQTYKRNAYRRKALAWLKQLPTYDDTPSAHIYQQLPALLRKTALSAFDRTEISQLSKQPWERWLDERCDKTHFVDNCPTLLHTLAYDPACNISQAQMKTLLAEITLWIKYHRSQHD